MLKALWHRICWPFGLARFEWRRHRALEVLRPELERIRVETRLHVVGDWLDTVRIVREFSALMAQIQAFERSQYRPPQEGDIEINGPCMERTDAAEKFAEALRAKGLDGDE